MGQISYFYISNSSYLEIIPPSTGFFKNKPGLTLQGHYIYYKNNEYYEFFTNTPLIEKRYYNGRRSYFLISGSEAKIWVATPWNESPEIRQLTVADFQSSVAPYLQVKDKTIAAVKKQFDKFKEAYPKREKRPIPASSITGYHCVPCAPIPTGGRPLDYYFIFSTKDGRYEFFTQSPFVAAAPLHHSEDYIEHSDILIPNALPVCSVSEFMEKSNPICMMTGLNQQWRNIFAVLKYVGQIYIPKFPPPTMSLIAKSLLSGSTHIRHNTSPLLNNI